MRLWGTSGHNTVSIHIGLIPFHAAMAEYMETIYNEQKLTDLWF